jgi:integrase
MQKRKDLNEDGIPNPEKVVQVALGHSSVTTTMSIYGDISVEDEAREADSNASFLTKLVNEN